MADKLTVGRIEKLSDTPFTAKLSADYQVKAVSAKELIERGKAEGRAEILALVQQKVDALYAQTDRQDVEQRGQFWPAIDVLKEILLAHPSETRPEPEKEQG